MLHTVLKISRKRFLFDIKQKQKQKKMHKFTMIISQMIDKHNSDNGINQIYYHNSICHKRNRIKHIIFLLFAIIFCACSLATGESIGKFLFLFCHKFTILMICFFHVSTFINVVHIAHISDG